MLSDEERVAALRTTHPEYRVSQIFVRLNARELDAIESAATAPLLARIAELEEELACVRQALPEQWRDSVPSVAVSTLVAELEEARKDAELLDYIQTNGATIELIPGAPDFYPMHFRVGGRYHTANESVRSAIRAAIKEQTK